MTKKNVLDALAEGDAFDVPPSLFKQEYESVARAMNPKAADHDHDHDHDSEHTDEEREQAVRRLKSFLLIEGVRKQAKVEVTDEEFETFAAERAEQGGIKLEEMQRSGRVDDLRRELEEKKVFDLLGEKAKIKEEKV